MRYALVAVLALAIGVGVGTQISRSQAVAEASATPTPSTTASPYVFDHRSFTVAVSAVDYPNDPAPAQIASRLTANLGPAWAAATRGRSQLFIRGAQAQADVLIVVERTADADAQDWTVAYPWLSVVVLHEAAGIPLATYDRIAIHELGHALGATHSSGCPAPAPSTDRLLRGGAIMCALVGDAPTFNDGELAQMGLAAP